MRPTAAWGVGGAVGVTLGYLLAVAPHGDLWFGSVLAAVSAVATYGALRFPDHLRRPALSSGEPWLYLVAVLGVAAVTFPSFGPALGDAVSVTVAVYLGALWLGGVTAGVALERRRTEAGSGTGD